MRFASLNLHFKAAGRDFATLDDGRRFHNIPAGGKIVETYRACRTTSVSFDQLIVTGAIQLMTPGIDIGKLRKTNNERTIVAARGIGLVSGAFDFRHLVLDTERVGVDFGGVALGVPLDGVIAGLHVGDDGGLHAFLHGILCHNFARTLFLDLISDQGKGLFIGSEDTQVDIRARTSTTAERKLRRETEDF